MSIEQRSGGLLNHVVPFTTIRSWPVQSCSAWKRRQQQQRQRHRHVMVPKRGRPRGQRADGTIPGRPSVAHGLLRPTGDTTEGDGDIGTTRDGSEGRKGCRPVRVRLRVDGVLVSILTRWAARGIGTRPSPEGRNSGARAGPIFRWWPTRPANTTTSRPRNGRVKAESKHAGGVWKACHPCNEARDAAGKALGVSGRS